MKRGKACGAQHSAWHWARARLVLGSWSLESLGASWGALQKALSRSGHTPLHCKVGLFKACFTGSGFYDTDAFKLVHLLGDPKSHQKTWPGPWWDGRWPTGPVPASPPLWAHLSIAKPSCRLNQPFLQPAPNLSLTLVIFLNLQCLPSMKLHGKSALEPVISGPLLAPSLNSPQDIPRSHQAGQLSPSTGLRGSIPRYPARSPSMTTCYLHRGMFWTQVNPSTVTYIKNGF